MTPVTDIVTPRFQVAILAAILLQGLQYAAMPTIISAAEQEMPRRHSLIHRSAVESSALPATPHETIFQPPSGEPTRITSQIGLPKNSVSLPTTPLPPNRPSTKHPAIASITAPATSSQTPRAARISGVAAGQVMQTTADPTKGTTPTTTAPITKSMAAPLPGMTSTGSAAVAQTAPSPFAGAAGVRSSTPAGSRSTPLSSGSRSALNLLQNSAIARLLQPPTTVVITPPSLPPPSTPPSTSPSTPPPPSPSTGNVTLTWTANREPDLAGYKIYIGTASGTYSYPGSPFMTGKVTSYTVSDLPKGWTYCFAISAYDSAGNESLLSAEVSKSIF